MAIKIVPQLGTPNGADSIAGAIVGATSFGSNINFGSSSRFEDEALAGPVMTNKKAPGSFSLGSGVDANAWANSFKFGAPSSKPATASGTGAVTSASLGASGPSGIVFGDSNDTSDWGPMSDWTDQDPNSEEGQSEFVVGTGIANAMDAPDSTKSDDPIENELREAEEEYQREQDGG